MDFSSWLTSWLKRHPVKTPDSDQRQFTQEVMARVRAAEAREPWWASAFSGFALPRFAVPALVAASVAALVLTLSPARFGSEKPAMTARIEQELAVLAELNNGALEGVEPDDDAEVLFRTADDIELMILAANEPGTDDAAWLEQTLNLLQQFDEDATAEAMDETSEEEWLKSIQELDDAELTARL